MFILLIHYLRKRLKCTGRRKPILQTETTVNKFISKIKFPSSWFACWIYTGSPKSKYGVFYYTKWWSTTAHRACMEIITGNKISSLYVVDHLCKNTRCVNPLHLEVVTQRINLLRGDTFNSRNAAKTICPNGHSFNNKNTYIDKLNSRHCRECDRLRKRGLL